MKATTRTLALLLALGALAVAATGAVAAPAGAKDSPRHGEAKEHKCKHRHDQDGKHRRRCDHDGDDDGGTVTAPDLSIAVSCPQTTIASGQQFECNVDLRNDGAPVTFAAGIAAVAVTVPTGFRIIASGGAFNGCSVNADQTGYVLCFLFADRTLAAGEVVSSNVVVQAPSVSCIDPAVSGDFAATADPTSVIAESDETNNATAVRITVNPANC